jgi:hypothetical protein
MKTVELNKYQACAILDVIEYAMRHLGLKEAMEQNQSLFIGGFAEAVCEIDEAFDLGLIQEKGCEE